MALVAGVLAAAAIEDWTLGGLDRMGPWAYPAAVALLLAIAGVILLVRGSVFRQGEPARWSPPAVATIVVLVVGAVLAARQWGTEAALRFGPPELAALVVLMLAVALALARCSRIQAAAMALLGLLLASIGLDLATGIARFTMGLDQLMDGIAPILVPLGLVVVADGAICLVSPALLVATYARQVAGWGGPRVSPVAAPVMRIAAVLAIAASGTVAFTLNLDMWDVGALAVFGAFGVACKLLGWNRLVLLLAFAYGPLLEENLRRALVLSQGDPAIFVRTPIGGTLLLLAAAALAAAALSSARRAPAG